MEREICFFLDYATFKSVAYFAYNGRATDVGYSENYGKFVVWGAGCSLITDAGNIVPECKDGAFWVEIEELFDRGCINKIGVFFVPYEDGYNPEELINSVIDEVVASEQKMQENLLAGLAIMSYMGRNEIPS